MTMTVTALLLGIAIGGFGLFIVTAIAICIEESRKSDLDVKTPTIWYECKQCGAIVDRRDKYCRNCGKKF